MDLDEVAYVPMKDSRKFVHHQQHQVTQNDHWSEEVQPAFAQTRRGIHLYTLSLLLV